MSEARQLLEAQLALLEIQDAGLHVQIEKLKTVLYELVWCPDCNGSGGHMSDPDPETGRATAIYCERCKDTHVPEVVGRLTITRGKTYKIE